MWVFSCLLAYVFIYSPVPREWDKAIGTKLGTLIHRHHKDILKGQTSEEFLSFSPGEGGSYSSELRTQKNEAKNKAVFFDNIREGSKPRKICSGFESR
jgi:hypothetical protein